MAVAWRQASLRARPKTREPMARTWKTIRWAFDVGNATGLATGGNDGRGGGGKGRCRTTPLRVIELLKGRRCTI